MKNAITLIEAKREKHLTKHGYDSEHDKQHTEMDFLNAAKAYMFNDRHSWPFDKASFKVDSQIENLINAGSMIAAALDRILPSYQKGKLYKVDCIGGKGAYKVTRVGKSRKHTGTKFIYFVGVSGDISPELQTFSIGSEFDFKSEPI